MHRAHGMSSKESHPASIFDFNCMQTNYCAQDIFTSFDELIKKVKEKQ